jgi:triacylglycerol esterase/lipase EstA (alpha/beta hydrolase family)
MGGLAIRAYIREHGLQRIAQVITLGTPHGGTAVAQFGVGANCAQMHRSHDSRGGTPSRWLQRLEASENAQTRTRFVSIYSHHDNIIAPQTSSYLPSAINIGLHGIGHVTLAVDASVQSLVVEEIRKASRRQPPLVKRVAYSQPDFLKR